MSRTLTRNNVLVFTETLQSAAAATGNGTAVECLGFGALVAQVTGTFSGTVTFEGTVDGTNYIAIRGMNKNTGTSASTATAAGIFQFSVAGLKYFRARVSAYSSGSITVTATISPESEPALPAASTTAATVAIDQTTSGTTNKVVSTGAAAHDAAASGNPVQVGGVYRLADPALTDGDAGSIRLNAKGEPIVQVSGRKTQLRLITATSSTTVNASASETVTITPTASYMARVINTYLLVNGPAGAATGTHQVVFQIGNANADMLLARGVYNGYVIVNRNVIDTAASLMRPANAAEQNRNLLAMKFTVANPLQIVYTNSTDVNQTQPRTIVILVEEEAIV